MNTVNNTYLFKIVNFMSCVSIQSKIQAEYNSNAKLKNVFGFFRVFFFLCSVSSMFDFFSSLLTHIL